MRPHSNATNRVNQETTIQDGFRMPQTVQSHTLTNGMTLLGEPMEHVQSVAFVFLVPCGSARLPNDASGAGNVLLDWLYRGAGPRNSRS